MPTVSIRKSGQVWVSGTIKILPRLILCQFSWVPVAEICSFTFYFYLLLEDICHGYNKIPALRIHKEYPPVNKNAYWRQLANEMPGLSKKRRPKQSITEREFHPICWKATGAKAGCDSTSHWSTRLHFPVLRHIEGQEGCSLAPAREMSCWLEWLGVVDGIHADNTWVVLWPPHVHICPLAHTWIKL